MANAIYPLYKQRLLDPNMDANGAVDWNTDTIKIALRDNATVYNAAHKFLSDLAGATIGTPQTLTSPTVTNGTADAADPIFTAVASGSTVARYVVYKDSGNAATSPLIAFFDTDASSAAISIPTNGGNISITLSGSGIYAL